MNWMPNGAVGRGPPATTVDSQNVSEARNCSSPAAHGVGVESGPLIPRISAVTSSAVTSSAASLALPRRALPLRPNKWLRMSERSQPSSRPKSASNRD